MFRHATLPALAGDRIAPAPAGADSRGRWGTVLSAGVHVLILLALARIVLPPPRDPPAEWAVPLVFAPPTPPASSLPAEPETDLALATLPAPDGTIVTKQLRPLPHTRVAATQPRVSEAVPRSPQPAPTHLTEAAPAPRIAAAQPATPAPDAGWVAAFTSRVQAAVQHAATYPMAARQMHREGHVRVRFDYEDGAASAPEILVSSSEPLLDRAALRAVQNADYPAAPSALGRSRREMLVWVNFQLSPES